MVSNVYWISALSNAIALSIFYAYSNFSKTTKSVIDKNYKRLLGWVIFFCLQDAFWGICASGIILSKTIFFTSSTIFHLAIMITSAIWNYFVLCYLDKKGIHKKIYLAIVSVICIFQLAIVISNFFIPSIFRITDNNVYETYIFRIVSFLNQYVIFLFVGLISVVVLFKTKQDQRKDYYSVLAFVSSPILSGIFQLLFPDSPFYSLGYFIGCCIIHIFIISKQHEEQILIDSNYDELTGFLNRKSYEAEIKNFSYSQDFVYASFDVNGLKTINDTKGHSEGDKLLKSASVVLKNCFGGYGKIYRVGGDEFSALFYTSQKNLQELIIDFHEEMIKTVIAPNEILSISSGFVMLSEYPDKNIQELAKIADERMYKDKEEYYKNTGNDRRAQRGAFDALKNSYTKVLKVNLSTDEYVIIKMFEDEKKQSFGFANSISEWLKNFALSGSVHDDDKNNYLEKTNIEYLRKFFSEGNKNYVIHYKRKVNNTFRDCIMEMVPDNFYSHENQIVYLFVKTI